MLLWIISLFILLSCCNLSSTHNIFPLVINTWPWTESTDNAYSTLICSSDPNNIETVLTAIEVGCSTCERLQCDHTVGFGGSPDSSGETTLDSMIMNGDTMSVGAVGNLRRIKDAIKVARAVLNYTNHTFLTGDQATSFAVSLGFTETSLSTSESHKMHENWKSHQCQPNYWKNVKPNPTSSCGPYEPISSFYEQSNSISSSFDDSSVTYSNVNHDTIAMIAISADGKHIAAGTSTNGARYKIAGRVGDSSQTGSGAFAESSIGGCGSTGDGDIMMRFSPCALAMEYIRWGINVNDAAKLAMLRIVSYYPHFQGAIVVVDSSGHHTSASYGWNFSYAVRTSQMNQTQIISVPSLSYVELDKLRLKFPLFSKQFKNSKL